MSGKSFSFFYFLSSVLFIVHFLSAGCVTAEPRKTLPASEVLERLDQSKYTTAQIKEYLKSIEGSRIKGEGKVVNVLGGKLGKMRVTVLAPGSRPKKGYNIVLYTGQNAVAELNINDRISLEGELGRASFIGGGSIDVKAAVYRKLK
ncbi:MAG: hypothetical protein ACM34I_01965 [bacterium]